MSNITPRARRNRLLASCAAAAIATLTLNAPAAAQPIDGGFQGTTLPGTTGARVITPTPGSVNTRVEVDANRAIINWRPSDHTGTGVVDFLPTGRSADFVNSANRPNSPYTVLNRILPTDAGRVVAFNGNVRSTLSTVAGGAQGGNVWFYSPGGILVGAGATFDVGSLLLSANDLLNPQDFLEGGNRFQFGAATNSTAEIKVQGDISALGQSAYVALIAPRVVQSGAITVAGSAHYVAAEAVDMTINGSLFDIAVQVGSSVGGSSNADAALVHDGTTTLRGEETGYGPGPAAGRSAVLVAVPKNDAVTMLVQGAIGYEPATGAQVFGNRIILSGGRDVQNGEIVSGSRPGNPDGVASIRIDNRQVDNNVFARTTFGGDVEANATGAISVAARNTFPENGYGAAPADIDFAGNASFVAEGGVDVAALGRIDAETRGGSIGVGGSLALISDVTPDVTRAGNVRLSSGERSSVDVLGNVTVSARLTGGDDRNAINTRTAEIVATGGEITIGGDAVVTAAAFAGFGGEGGNGGNASGGTARIVVTSSAIAIGGDTRITASAFGGESSGGIGGTGQGGSAALTLTDAQFSTLSLDVDAFAFGGDSFDGTAGAALAGGRAGVTSSGSMIDLESISIQADSFGGDGLVGGNASAGTAALDLSGGRLTMTDQDDESLSALSISSSSFGGAGDFNEVDGASRGGNAVSGSARITVANAAQLSLTGLQSVTASAFGGDASNVADSIAGSAQAGPASIAVTGATLVSTGNGLSILSEAFGGDGGAAGAAIGGTIRFDATDATATLAELSLSSDAFGGDGESGGAGTGGTSTVALTRSDLTVSSLSRGLSVTAQGFGGDGNAAAGVGVGNIAAVTATNSTVDINDLVVVADGYGGEGVIGGAARAGDAAVDVVGGRFDAGDAEGRVIVTATAYGGDADGETGQQAGAAQGGTASVSGTGGAAVTLRGRILLQADGDGGNARNADGVGGNAQGGSASLTADDARIDALAQVLVSANAEGGDGDATGGDAIAGGGARADGTLVPGGVSLLVGGNSRIDAAGLTLRATGTGGSGLDGGDGTGGRVSSVIRATGLLNVLDDFQLIAEGIGGSSDDSGYGDGSFGTGRGGAITLDIEGDDEVPGELRVADLTLLSAAANPLRFSQEARQAAPSANGGDGFGGTANVTINGDFLTDTLRLDVTGRGNAGLDNFGGSNASATDGSTGQGGEATVTIGTGADTVDMRTLEIDATGLGGRGGEAGNPGDGGIGQGGTVTLDISDGETVIDFAALSANGQGGTGGDARFGATGTGGTGGAGVGGTVSVAVAGVEPFIGGLQVSLAGSGGSGGTGDGAGPGGTGGLGAGGTLALTVSGGGTLLIPVQAYAASGFGGEGGFGGLNGGSGGSGGAGGAGVGGTIAIDVIDATLGAPSEVVYGTAFLARGEGGAGGRGRDFGGEGGGNGGDGGAGGSATGGEIAFAGVNATLDFSGIELDAGSDGGFGGSGGAAFEGAGGDGGRGGAASDGSVSLRLSDNGTGNVSVTGFAGIALAARAEGGGGGDGGTGSVGGQSGDGGAAVGGSVSIGLAGTLTLATALGGDVSAAGGDGGSGFDNGYGAQAAAGGAGGSGTGGAISLTVASGNVQLEPNTQLSAFGDGGSGGSSDRRAGGAGGAGVGGTIEVAATGGRLSAPSLRLRADGSGANGGAGGDDTSGGEGGRGGDAEGGEITLRTAGAGQLVTNFGSGRGLEAHADARAGFGGSGGSGSAVGDTGGRGGNGGNALSGSVAFAVAGGAMDLGNIKVTANGWGGGFSAGGVGAGRAAVPDNPDTPEDESQPEIPPTFAAGGSDGRGNGGEIGFLVADGGAGQAGRLLAGQVSLRATGRFGGGDNDAAGSISLVRTGAALGGAFQFDSLEAKTLGVNGETITGFELDSAAGAIEILGNASIMTDKDAVLRASGSGTLAVGGTLDLEVGNVLTLVQAPGATDVLASANLIRIGAGAVAGGSETLTAVRDIRADSPGSVAFGRLDAGDDIVINAFSATIGEAITRGPDEEGEEETGGSDIVVNSIGDIEFLTGADARSDMQLTSSGGGIFNARAGATGLQADGRIDLFADLDIRLASAASGFDVSITSVAGSVASSGLIQAEDDVRIMADQFAVALTHLAAGDLIDLRAGTDLSLANADAGGLLSLSGTNINLTGSGTGADIFAVGDTMSLGDLTATSPEFGGEGADGIVLVATGDATVRSGTSATRIDVDASGFNAGSLTAAEAVLIELTDSSQGSGIADLGTVRAAYVEVDARNGIAADAVVTVVGGIGFLTNARIDLASTGGDVRLDIGASPGVIALSAESGAVRSDGLLQAEMLTANAATDIALNDVDVSASLGLSAFGGAISGGRFVSDSDISLFARDGVAVAALDAFRFINVDGGSGPISIGSATTTALGGEGSGGIFLRTNGLVTLDEANSAGFIDVKGLGFGGGDLLAAGYVRIRINEDNGYGSQAFARAAALGGIVFDSAKAGQFVELTAPGAIDVGTVIAGTNISAVGGSIAFAAGTAGRDILLKAAGAISVGAAVAGDDIEIASRGGIVTVANAITTGLGEDLNEPGDGSNVRLAAAGAIRLDNGTAIDLVELASAGASVKSAGLITAANLDVASARDIALTDLDIANGISLFAGSGSITGNAFVSGRSISLRAFETVEVANLATRDNIFVQGGTIDLGSATTTDVGGEGGGGIRLDSLSLVTLGNGDSAGFIDVSGTGFDGGALTAAGFARIQVSDEGGYGSDLRAFAAAPGAISLDAASAGSFVLLSAPGAIDAGPLTAGTDILADGASITIAGADAGRDVLLDATVDIRLTQAQAGDDVEARSQTGGVTAGRVVTTGLGEDAGENGYGPGDGSNIRLSGPGAVHLDDGQVIDLIELAASGATVNSATLLRGRDLRVASAGNIALTDVEISNALSLTAANGSITGDNFVSGALLALTASDMVDVDSLNATRSIIVQGRSIDIGSATAGDDLTIIAREAITLASGIATDQLVLRSSATEAASTEAAAANRTITAGALRAGILAVDAAGAANLQTIRTTGNASVESASAITLGTSLAGGELTVIAADYVTTGGMTAGSVSVSAGRQLTTGNVMAASGTLALTGGTGTLQTGALAAFDALTLDALGGTIATGDITSARATVDLAATGDMTLGNVRAGGSIFLTGGGRITAGGLTAGTLAPSGGTPAPGGPSGPTTADIAPGFNDFAFPANDDGATGAIVTPFSLNFFGQTYEQLFVSNNGYVTFDSGQGTFTPSGLGEDYSGQPIIAAFFADVDTRGAGSALLTYGPGEFAGRPAFGATWDGVGYFPSQADKLNNFQLLLTDRSDTGAGNFDIFFNYARISWETGSASGGTNGFGGVSAAVGYNAGTGNQPGTHFELSGSRVNGAFLDNGSMALIAGTNNGVPGQLQFQVRNGQVNPGGGTGGSFGTGDIRVTNNAAGNTAAITLGDLAARDINVTGGGAVTTGNVDANRDVAQTAAGALAYGRSEADGKTTLAGLTIDGGITTAGGDLIANGGRVTIAQARAGDDITIRASDVALIGAVATTGQGTDGETNGFVIDIEAANDVSFGQADAFGDLRVVSRDGGLLRLGAPSVAGANVIEAGGSIFLSAARSLGVDRIVAGRDATLRSGGDILVSSVQAGDDIAADAAGAFTATSLVATGQAADSGETAATGIVAQAGPDGSNIRVVANGAVAIGTGTAKDLISLRSQTGAINSAAALTAGGDLFATAAGPITLVDAKAGRHAEFNAGGPIAAQRVDAGRGLSLVARNDAVTVSQDVKSGEPLTASGTAVTLNAAGPLSVGTASASAGTVALTSVGNLLVANANASGNVTVTSGEALALTGTVAGNQISLASRDIAIGESAQIGSAQRTGAIQITANATSATVGGSSQGGGYRLANAEFARLAGQNVSIGVQGENATLQVDTLTVRQGSVTRSLDLASSSDVEMVGRLTYEDAGANNVVRVNVARTFFADAAGAGIAVTDAQGALTGSIDIDARSIVIASRQAQADLASVTTIAARDERLGRNDGTTDDAGFLRAGAIRLAASERIQVQNSGLTSDVNEDRAGLSAGAGGITLVTKGTAPVEIVINGRQSDGLGGFVTGAALIDSLTITGQQGAPASFAAGSTVNGCIIGGSNCLAVPLAFIVPVEPVISELSEEEDEDEENNAFAGPPSVGFNQLITTDGSPLLPVIDDPVTGAGNDDLITNVDPDPDFGAVPGQGAVDQPVTGTGNEALQGGAGLLVEIVNSQRVRDEQVNAPVTGTGNEALQGGTTPPPPAGSPGDSEPIIDEPVTGAGNDGLQDEPSR